MNKINAVLAAGLVALSGAAFAQDSAHDSMPDAARQDRMDQAYHDHQGGGTASNDLHDAGHSIHNGVRSAGHAIHSGVRATGHAIHDGVRATGHAIHRGVRATGHAIHRTVDGNEAPQARSASTTTHP